MKLQLEFQANRSYASGIHITTEHNISVITAAVFWDVQGSGKYYITWRFLKPNIIRVIQSREMKQAQHMLRIDDGRGAYRDVVGKIKEKRIFGRSRRRWDDNIKTDLL